MNVSAKSNVWEEIRCGACAGSLRKKSDRTVDHLEGREPAWFADGGLQLLTHNARIHGEYVVPSLIQRVHVGHMAVVEAVWFTRAAGGFVIQKDRA